MQTLPELPPTQRLSLIPTLPHPLHAPSVWVYKPFCEAPFALPALGNAPTQEGSAFRCSPAGLTHTHSKKALILSPTRAQLPGPVSLLSHSTALTARVWP